MKNLLLLVTLIFTTATFAQVEKASEGTIYEVMFSPNLEGDSMFGLNNPLSGHITKRTFNDANSVTRWKAHVSFASVDGNDDDNMVFGLYYGKEKHHSGSSRLGTYTGWEAGLLYADINGAVTTNVSGGVFVGANYYIANNLYIGTEINFRATLGDGFTTIAPSVNPMLSIGFKL